MRALKYLTPYIFPPLVVLGVALGGGWTFLVAMVIFGALPIVEWLTPVDTDNSSAEAFDPKTSSLAFDLVVWLAVPLQVGVTVFAIAMVGSGTLSWLETVGVIFSTGVTTTSVGINVGHTLGHRTNIWEQRMAKLLYLCALYMHFHIEHNRGHHKRVATDEDPASARRGEILYTFWFRSLLGGYRSAWELENKRLRRRGERVFSLKNEMVAYHLIQGAALLGALLAFGPGGLAAYVAIAAVAIFFLETVNYIEHYGLRRGVNAKGRTERVRPAHSWNSDHPVGRILLFELPRHSDHHANPTRHYQALRHFDDAPQFPYGYPSMILLSFVPPLFFRVVHPVLDETAELRMAS